MNSEMLKSLRKSFTSSNTSVWDEGGCISSDVTQQYVPDGSLLDLNSRTLGTSTQTSTPATSIPILRLDALKESACYDPKVLQPRFRYEEEVESGDFHEVDESEHRDKFLGTFIVARSE